MPQLSRQRSKYLPNCGSSSHEIWGRGRLSNRWWPEFNIHPPAAAAKSHYQFLGGKNVTLQLSRGGVFEPESCKKPTQEAHLLSCHIETLADNLDPPCVPAALSTCQRGSKHWAAAECNSKPGQISHFCFFFMNMDTFSSKIIAPYSSKSCLILAYLGDFEYSEI